MPSPAQITTRRPATERRGCSRRRRSTADSGDLRLHRPVQGPVRVEPIWRVLELVRKRMLLLKHVSDNRIQPPDMGLRNAARRLEPRLHVGQAVRGGRRPASRNV